MPRNKFTITHIVAEGNYLCKSRRNFYISQEAWKMLHELSLSDGQNHSSELELMIRKRYRKKFGAALPVPLRQKVIDDGM